MQEATYAKYLGMVLDQDLPCNDWIKKLQIKLLKWTPFYTDTSTNAHAPLAT